MEVSAELHGGGEWTAALRHKERAVAKATERAAVEGMRVVERTVKRALRTYTHPPGTPTTSPPGSPPALVTGELMRSWRTRGPLPGRTRHQVRIQGGPTKVYSRIQELGGRVRRGEHQGLVGPVQESGYVTLPPRPYMRPAVMESRRPVRRVFVRRWSEALRA